MIATNAVSMIKRIVGDHGTTVSIYDPTVTLNDEGDPSYTLGTASSIKCVIFNITEEEPEWSVAGLNLKETFVLYMKPDQDADEESIFLYNSKYYKIYSIASVVVEGTTVYKRAVITKHELNI